MDADLVQRLVDQVDVVYHLAAAVGVRFVLENPLRSLLTNIRGTEKVLEADVRAPAELAASALVSLTMGRPGVRASRTNRIDDHG